MDLGSAPCDEPCAQVGEDDYTAKAKDECRRYIDLLVAIHGEPPTGARLRMKGNPHDFGTYYSVVVDFDDEDDTASDYAYLLEGNLPATWYDGQNTCAAIEFLLGRSGFEAWWSDLSEEVQAEIVEGLKNL